MNCIYCKQEIISGQNSSKEHIFPDAFGCPNDFVIHCVCERCNNTFGGTIDRWLNHDSFEAIKRLRLIGSKSKQPLKYYKRLTITIPDEEIFDDFRSAIVQINIENPKQFILPNQVGFLNKVKKYEFILLDELKYFDKLNKLDDRLKNLSLKNIKILSRNAGELDKTMKILQELKIKSPKFKITDKQFGFPKKALNNKKTLVNIHGIIDQEILRAIAKISFNYLAYIRGDRYCLLSKFDNIRNFISSGQNESKITYVMPNAKHILSSETDNLKFFNGFLINFERENNSIVSRVSLFNDLTYKIYLSNNSETIWLTNFNSGHAYDYKNNKLIKLGSINSNLIFL